MARWAEIMGMGVLLFGSISCGSRTRAATRDASRFRPGALLAAVDATGATLAPADGAWRARIHATSLACGARTRALGEGAPHRDGLERVTAARGEGIDEWFAGSARGIEQGFTIHRPCSVRLVVHLDVAGLTARTRALGGAELVDAQGVARVAYTDLSARDANGRALPVGMTAGGGGIDLVVKTVGAAFPVVIDPLMWIQSQELAAGDGVAHDGFGLSVALAGDTALIGAPADSTRAGAAYVFLRSGSTWAQAQKLTASDGAAGNSFGVAVATSADTGLVGACQDAVGGNTAQGSVYVFARNGSTWSEQQKLTASDGVSADQLGISLAVSGGTAVAGAPGNGVGGAVYVFVRTGTTWSEQQKLVASDAASPDYLGDSAALDGDTALAGADGKTVGSNLDQGAAYVFVRTGTTWSEQQKLVASDGVAHARFGTRVSLAGDTALVGAPGDYLGGAPAQQGAVYVFERTGMTWSEQQKLVASDGGAGDGFGLCTSLSADTALVGSWSFSAIGKAYVFARSGTTWSEHQKLVAGDGAVNDFFGLGGAVDTTTVIVGAAGHAVGSNTSQGDAYVFDYTSGAGGAGGSGGASGAGGAGGSGGASGAGGVAGAAGAGATGGAAGTGGAAAAGGAAGAGATSNGGTGGSANSDAGIDAAAGTSGSEGAGSSQPRGGCGCSAAGSGRRSGAPWLLALALGTLGLRRRD